MIQIKPLEYIYYSLASEQQVILNQLKPFGSFEEPVFKIDFKKINAAYTEKTGLTLVLVNERITIEEYLEMVTRGEVPLATETDHDLVLHILPAITHNKFDLKSLFIQARSIKNDIARAWAFEYVNILEKTSETRCFASCLGAIKKDLTMKIKTSVPEDEKQEVFDFFTEDNIRPYVLAEMSAA